MRLLQHGLAQGATTWQVIAAIPCRPLPCQRCDAGVTVTTACNSRMVCLISLNTRRAKGAHFDGNCHITGADPAERPVRDVRDRAGHRAQGAPAAADRERRPGRDRSRQAGRGSHTLLVDGADRHHLDRRAQRRGRRIDAGAALRRLAAQQCWHVRVHRRLRRHRDRGGRPDLLFHRAGRAGAQAPGPDGPRIDCAHGGAPDLLARGGVHPLRQAAVELHPAGAAPARHQDRQRPRRDRGRNPRAAGRRLRGGRDRAARAHHGAQRVPPRRPPAGFADGAARRRRLPGRGCAAGRKPAPYRGIRPLPLPGGARRHA
ncbi:hypothetical protein D9M72_463710 [compost metagenome]